MAEPLRLYRALASTFWASRVGLSEGRLFMPALGAWMARDSVRNVAGLAWYWSVPRTWECYITSGCS